ncbi:MAG: hypothetical protein ACRCTW_08930 [Lactococcus garvieae]
MSDHLKRHHKALYDEYSEVMKSLTMKSNLDVDQNKQIFVMPLPV